MIPIDQECVFALAIEAKNKTDDMGTVPSAVLSSREALFLSEVWKVARRSLHLFMK